MPLIVKQADAQSAESAADKKPPISHNLLKFVILILIWVVSFSSRMFSVVRFESIIHEFDPWFVLIL